MDIIILRLFIYILKMWNLILNLYIKYKCLYGRLMITRTL